jgi:hypothetical protein
MEFVRKIMATVAIPAELAEFVFGFGAGVVLLTMVTVMKHIAINRADTQSVGLRPHRSEKKRMYTPTMINFSAPNRPVMSRF